MVLKTSNLLWQDKQHLLENKVQNLIVLRHAFLFLQVCLIGKSRSYEQAQEDLAEVKRTDYIRGRQVLINNSAVVTQKEHSGPHHHGDGQEMAKAGCDWGNGFQPREKIETVRNCAALPRDFVDGVVLKVAMTLLGLPGEKTEEEEENEIGKERIRWNAGGKKSMAFLLL